MIHLVCENFQHLRIVARYYLLGVAKHHTKVFLLARYRFSGTSTIVRSLAVQNQVFA